MPCSDSKSASTAASAASCSSFRLPVRFARERFIQPSETPEVGPGAMRELNCECVNNFELLALAVKEHH